MNLPTISHDKALHAIYGYMTFTLTITLAFLVFPLLTAFAIGAAATVAVAVGREVWQYVSGSGTPDVRDVWATLAGGAGGAFAIGVGLGLLGMHA